MCICCNRCRALMISCDSMLCKKNTLHLSYVGYYPSDVIELYTNRLISFIINMKKNIYILKIANYNKIESTKSKSLTKNIHCGVKHNGQKILIHFFVGLTSYSYGITFQYMGNSPRNVPSPNSKIYYKRRTNRSIFTCAILNSI